MLHNVASGPECWATRLRDRAILVHGLWGWSNWDSRYDLIDPLSVPT